MTGLRVRFQDFERYDIVTDADVIMFQGITGTGTYFGETRMDSARHVREKRKEFQEYVIECMQDGIGPHEVEIG